MSPYNYSPVFYQGDSWVLDIGVTQLVSGSAAAFDLTGYTAKSQMRKSMASSATMLDFTCTIAAPSGGNINLSASPSLTALVPAGTYVWDVQISGTSGTASGTVQTIARGYALVEAEVTK